ncbi:ATPase AAA [Spirosoma humi]
MISLSDLGKRICILGPSNSGKSTLANAIGRKCSLDVIHLDQLHHLPNTDWQVRPSDEFIALHNAAIAGDQWVIEGNYSICMGPRFERATGLILLDVSTLTSLWRYVNRTLFELSRYGGLEGSQDSLKWIMIHHIIAGTPKNRIRYERMFQALTLPKIRLSSVREINRFYKRWELQPHS